MKYFLLSIMLIGSIVSVHASPPELILARLNRNNAYTEDYKWAGNNIQELDKLDTHAKTRTTWILHSMSKDSWYVAKAVCGSAILWTGIAVGLTAYCYQSEQEEERCLYWQPSVAASSGIAVLIGGLAAKFWGDSSRYHTQAQLIEKLTHKKN